MTRLPRRRFHLFLSYLLHSDALHSLLPPTLASFLVVKFCNWSLTTVFPHDLGHASLTCPVVPSQSSRRPLIFFTYSLGMTPKMSCCTGTRPNTPGILQLRSGSALATAHGYVPETFCRPALHNRHVSHSSHAFPRKQEAPKPYIRMR